MIIKNASVYTEDGRFLPKDIYIEGNAFVNRESRNGIAAGCIHLLCHSGTHGYPFSRLYGI